ncbi:unnamed protein product, partial [Heterosigma akashiwo]
PGPGLPARAPAHGLPAGPPAAAPGQAARPRPLPGGRPRPKHLGNGDPKDTPHLRGRPDRAADGGVRRGPAGLEEELQRAGKALRRVPLGQVLRQQGRGHAG